MNACKTYKFVALQNNGWCSCDNSYSTPSSTYRKRPAGECNQGGIGKGGPWRNAVYTNARYSAPKTPAHFRGCYQDNGSRDFKAGPKRYGYTSTSCMNACKTYKFVALQNNGWCSCDNSYSTPSSTYRKRPAGECNQGGIGKGGPWRNAVYTNARYSAPKSQRYLGCYQDNGSRDFRAGPKRYGYRANTCAAACKGYTYVALQNGGWCSCDNSYSTPSSTYRKRPTGECNKGFTGGGGPWRNAVYTNPYKRL